MQDLDVRAGDELERQLARYARVRLDPGPAVVRRARESVMTEAWRQRLGAPEAARPGRRGPFAGWPARRLAVSLAAALLAGLLIGSSAFAASRAGGPLYEARLTLDAMTLPSDPDARLEAELAQAQSRIADAVDAAARHDDGALAAALAAYGRSLDDLSATTGGPADRALQAVEFHRTVLLRLSESAPSQAVRGITNALDHSQGAIDKLDATVANGKDNGGGGNSGGNSGGNGGSGGGGSGGNGGGGNGGNGNGGPAASQDAQATPTPERSHGPVRTPGPARSPKPAASVAPSGEPGGGKP